MESSNEIWAGREETLIIRNRDGALQLRMGAEEAVIKKSATAMYLYELLIHPNKPIRALDLDALINPPEITCQSLYHSSNAELAAQGLYVQSRRDKDPCMDEQGIKEIKQRLVALNEKYAQLMEWHDYAALEEVSEERERLIEYLAPLLNPHHSPVLEGESTRRKEAILKSIRRGISRIAEQAPRMGDYLKKRVRLGEWVCFAVNS